MRRLITTGLAVALAAAVSTPALAGDKYFQHRFEAQGLRAEQGVDSGALTYREARAVKKEHKGLSKARYRKASDGNLSCWDRRSLEHGYDRASRHIYRLKHNDRYRVSG